MSNISQPCDCYNEWEKKKRIVKALNGGTQGMRDCGNEYLPKFPKETPESYQARLNSSFLFPAYKHAKETLIGEMFSKPVMIETDNELLKQIEVDANAEGQDITSFLRVVEEDAIDSGVSYVLVDAPATPPTLSAADEQQLGIRPFFKHVKCEDLISWDFERIDGVDVLMQIRIKETIRERENDQYVTHNQIREITPTEWRIYRSQEDGNYSEFDSGVWSIGEITLVSFQANMIGRMVGEPAMLGLAELNVQHWQLDSDHNSLIHKAAVPILFGKGLGEESPDTIGADVMITTDNVDADLRWVELDGKGIQPAEKKIEKIEERMALLALQPLLQKTGGITATKTAIDSSKSNSQIIAWAIACNDALNKCLSLAMKWVNQDDEFKAEVHKDYLITLDNSDADVLLKARMAGEISQETFHREMKRRGIFGDDHDIEEELETLENELDSFDERIGSTTEPDVITPSQ